MGETPFLIYVFASSASVMGQTPGINRCKNHKIKGKLPLMV